MASGADAVSFDLEDAVVPERKAEAREGVAAFLAGAPQGGPQRIVRVNPVDTPWFAEDLAAVATAALSVVNLPKVEDPDVVRGVARELERIEAAKGLGRAIPILVNIETPRGVRRAVEIAPDAHAVIHIVQEIRGKRRRRPRRPSFVPRQVEHLVYT